MDDLTKGILSANLLKSCNCDMAYSVYSFVPNISKEIELYTHNLHNIPQILDPAIDLFAGKKSSHKNSIYYSNLKKSREELIRLLNNVCEFVGYREQKNIGQNKIPAALSYISHIYFDTFTDPIQFFLPNSSVCSGKWEFWDNIDFFSFKENLKNKEHNFIFRDKVTKSELWNIKFDLNEFPIIVQRRLIKEKLLNKKLDPESMIKAIIIRLGEMGRPFINYEVIDLSIREFFTYLGTKKYLRVDREMELLKRLDNEIIKLLKE